VQVTFNIQLGGLRTWFISQLSNATYCNIVGRNMLCTFGHSVALKYCNRLAGAQLKPYLDLKGKASVNIHCKPYSYLAIRSLITIPSQLCKLPKHIVVILSELRSELKRKTQLICATTDTFQFNNFNPISFFSLVQSSACYRWLRPTSSLFCKFLHWPW